MEEETLGTSYDLVIDAFLAKIDDYKMLNYSDDDIYEDALGYMKHVCGEFGEVCEKDLSARDDEAGAFVETLSNREIDIISLGMVVEWMRPVVNKADALHNVMNLKDATFFSPAKITEQKRGLYQDMLRAYEKAYYNYTYYRGDLEAFRV